MAPPSTPMDAGPAPDAAFGRISGKPSRRRHADAGVALLYLSRASAGDIPCAARRIAFVALCLVGFDGREVGKALTLAARAIAQREPLAPSTLKRATSDARALLAYGTIRGLPILSQPLDGDGRNPGEGFAQAVLAASLADARNARATALGGALGGRRPRVYSGLSQAIGRLIRRAMDGDAAAKAHLEQVAAVMAACDRPGRASPRRQASGTLDGR